MSPIKTPFFNLPQATLNKDMTGSSYFGAPKQHSLTTNWKTLEVQPMNKKSLFDVFAGTVPVVRQKDFLSNEECKRMVEVLKTHDIV